MGYQPTLLVALCYAAVSAIAMAAIVYIAWWSDKHQKSSE